MRYLTVRRITLNRISEVINGELSSQQCLGNLGFGIVMFGGDRRRRCLLWENLDLARRVNPNPYRGSRVANKSKRVFFAGEEPGRMYRDRNMWKKKP